MVGGHARRWVLGLCGLALVALATPQAMAFGGHGGGGHGGFGGFHGGGFDRGFRGGVGFGFGCCYGGFGYYDPFYAYGYGYPPAYGYGYDAPPYASSPAYVSPSPYASGETPPLAYDASNPPTSTPQASVGASGGDCREYQSPVVIGGRRETAYGYACRQPDGTWRVTTP
jgi:hypothetical protein